MALVLLGGEDGGGIVRVGVAQVIVALGECRCVGLDLVWSRSGVSAPTAATAVPYWGWQAAGASAHGASSVAGEGVCRVLALQPTADGGRRCPAWEAGRRRRHAALGGLGRGSALAEGGEGCAVASCFGDAAGPLTRARPEGGAGWDAAGGGIRHTT